MMRNPLRIPNAPLMLALLLAIAATPATAASTSTSFNVTATVVDACGVSATDLAFGTCDPTSAVDKIGSSTISVTCSLGTVYTVSLNDGVNAAGGVRRMASGANRLGYQLYRDAAHLLIFGTLANLLNASGVGTGLVTPFTVFGKVPKAQNVATGSYSDQITVTIDY
jgi:spore coat protein U-like protein